MVEGACAMDINSCVKASVEPKGNSMPVVPSLMSSQFEGQSLAIGGTPAAIASTMVPIRTMDIGVPILAMHSARELMGREDQRALTRLLQVFFEQD